MRVCRPVLEHECVVPRGSDHHLTVQERQALRDVRVRGLLDVQHIYPVPQHREQRIRAARRPKAVRREEEGEHVLRTGDDLEPRRVREHRRHVRLPIDRLVGVEEEKRGRRPAVRGEVVHEDEIVASREHARPEGAGHERAAVARGDHAGEVLERAVLHRADAAVPARVGDLQCALARVRRGGRVGDRVILRRI